MRIHVNLFLGGMIMLLVRCKSDTDNSIPKCYDPRLPECENYDPCFFASEVTADFEIEAEIYSAGIWADSFVAGIDQFKRGDIRFRALEDNAQYKWIIGIETLYTQLVIRNFYNVQSGAIIPVQLEINKAPNTSCYPFDDGEDKKNREFRLVTSGNDFNFIGQYKGKFEHRSDSTFLSLSFDDDELVIAEIYQSDSILVVDPSLVDGYATDLLFVLDGDGHLTPKGDIRLDHSTNLLRMKYDHVKTPLNTTETIVFKGRKLD